MQRGGTPVMQRGGTPVMQRGWSRAGPLNWIRFINKQVKVKAGKDEEHRGWLMTVDPVTGSLVLVTFREAVAAAAAVAVVMGHAVEEVEVLQEADEETTRRLQTSFLPSRGGGLDPEERRRRRGGVRTWLEKNRVPVEEEGEELRVAGVLTITAPYGPEDCRSSNQIILDRVQKLIRTGRLHAASDVTASNQSLGCPSTNQSAAAAESDT